MDYADALKLAEAYKTPRYRSIERLERYVDGTIHDGRPDFFVDNGTPLLERRPCIRYAVAKIAIRSHADMVLGEGKWPRVKLRTTATPGIDAKEFEKLLAAIVEQAELRARLHDGLRFSMGGKSCCFVGTVRRGKLGLQVFSGKACTLERNADGDPVKLTIEYPYLEEFKDQNGKWGWRVMLYRREVDELNDNVYVPVVGETDGCSRPSQIDKAKSKEHGLGFCPVDWYAFMPPGGHDDALDGCALHEEQLSEIDVMNIGLSQRARAAHYAGDPQTWESGVGPNENPAPAGRQARSLIGAVVGPNGETLFGVPNSAPTGRKKGVGVVWTYTDEKARVGMLTLPGDALEALDNHCQDLIRKVEKALAYVSLDSEKAHATTQKSSGRALQILLKPQLDFDGQIREDFGEHAICSVISLLVRIAVATNKKAPGGVYLQGLTELAPAIEAFERQVEGQERGVWMPPPLDLHWGPMVDTTGEDLKTDVEATIEAKNEGLISRRTAAIQVSHAFSVEDVDAELLTIDTEKAAAAAAAPSTPGQPQKPEGAAGALPGGVRPATPSQGPAAKPTALQGPAPPKDDGKESVAKEAEKLADRSETAPEKVLPVKAPIPGTTAIQQAPTNLHQRGSSAAGVTETVYANLKDDYKAKDIEWVRAAHWEGPLMVPLDQIDFQNRDNWAASHEPDKVADFVTKIQNGELKPIILVNEPNDNKLRLVDGHHRALAYEQLGQPAMAYVAHVGTIGGAWDDLHDSQVDGNKLNVSKQTTERA